MNLWRKTNCLVKSKRYTVLVFLVMFLIINDAVHVQVLHHKNEEELKATYTAEETIRRIELQLNRYLAKSDLLKRIIEQSCTLSDKEFDDMTALMIDDGGVLQCIELAKDGIVTQLYPLNQSEVIGHTMFDKTERGACARKAMESGEVVPAHEVVNLNEFSNDIQAIVGKRAAEAGVSLCYNRLSDERVYPYVYGSPLHLRQIFLNIYGDAIKYSHVGGSVKTQLTCFGAENGTVTYRWTITDTGIGMSETFLQHIFEPFAQERLDARSVYSGTGLGMSIVKTLVDKMHGTITVKSAPNEGSTFVITLPFEIADAQQPAVRETGEKESICGLHLLLVEDNELNAEIAETLLRDKGAEITVVSDGTQAIEKFTDSLADTYDAIIMDIMMPEVDGLAATRDIRAMKRPDAWRIPIIAMTANAFDEDVRHCLATGMNAHLAKPLQIDSIVQTIAELCNK